MQIGLSHKFPKKYYNGCHPFYACVWENIGDMTSTYTTSSRSLIFYSVMVTIITVEIRLIKNINCTATKMNFIFLNPQLLRE